MLEIDFGWPSELRALLHRRYPYNLYQGRMLGLILPLTHTQPLSSELEIQDGFAVASLLTTEKKVSIFNGIGEIISVWGLQAVRRSCLGRSSMLRHACSHYLLGGVGYKNKYSCPRHWAMH